MKTTGPSVLFTALLVFLLAVAPGPGSAQRPPIKIGFMTDLTGTAAQAAKDMVNGLTLYLDEIGHQMAGRKVELIVEDSQTRPDVAITKLRKLVEHDRVHIVAGMLFGHIAYALAPKAEEYRIPTLVTTASSDDLTQRLKLRWVVRIGWSSSQPSHPFGEYAAKTLGYRKVAVIGSDYAFGWEVISGFHRTFEESGGQIIQKLWVPLGAMDLAPYIGKLRRDADAVMTMVAGVSTLQFVKQYQEAGLKGRIPLIAGGPAVDESFLPSMGDEALGILSPLIYSGALDTPANRRFVGDYRKRFGKVPPISRRPTTRQDGGSTRRSRRSAATSRTVRSSWPPCGRSGSPTPSAARSSSMPTAIRSRTCTSGRPSATRTESFRTP